DWRGEARADRGNRDADWVARDDALRALAAIDERKSRIVELRFFGGLSEEETAEALKISPATVRRDWKVAKVWLLHELKKGQKDGDRALETNQEALYGGSRV